MAGAAGGAVGLAGTAVLVATTGGGVLVGCGTLVSVSAAFAVRVTVGDDVDVALGSGVSLAAGSAVGAFASGAGDLPSGVD